MAAGYREGQFVLKRFLESFGRKVRLLVSPSVGSCRPVGRTSCQHVPGCQFWAGDTLGPVQLMPRRLAAQESRERAEGLPTASNSLPSMPLRRPPKQQPLVLSISRIHNPALLRRYHDYCDRRAPPRHNCSQRLLYCCVTFTVLGSDFE